MKCTNCKFFNTAESECRRYAPSPTENGSNASWPSVSAEDWCGEFVAADEQRAAA